MSGKADSETEREKWIGAMELVMTDSGWITKLTALEYSIMLMVIFTRGIGQTIKQMDSVFTYTRTEQSTKENGNKISKTV